MTPNELIRQTFPLSFRAAAEGIAQGIGLSLVLWMPLPKSVQISKWFLILAVIVLAGIIFLLWFFGLKIIEQTPRLSWRGLGMVVSGVVFPLFPLGNTIVQTTNPIVFLIAGCALIIIAFILTWVKLRSAG